MPDERSDSRADPTTPERPVSAGVSGAQMLLDSAAERLPTPDGVALAIMQAWENEDTTVQQMARLVQTDPSLSGRVLKLANSAASGCRPVAAVPDAIIRIGMQTVGQLAIAFSLIGKDGAESCPGFDYSAYWARCLLMAVLARGLGEATRIASPEDLFACALLARIGILGLASVYPDEYAKLLSNNPSSLALAEKETFGVDHNELTELMMTDFFVPRALAEPARHHEAPDQSGFDPGARHQKITVLLHLAYRLSDAATDAGGRIGADPAVLDVLCAQLGLEEGRIATIFDQALVEWRDWSELLQLSIEQAPAYRDLDFQALEAPSEAQAAGASPEDLEVRTEALSATILADANIETGLKAVLGELRISASSCEKASEAVQLAMEKQANLFFVSEAHERLIKMIRGADAGDASYIFAVLEEPDVEREVQAYATGADQVIAAGITAAHLSTRLAPAIRCLKRHARWGKDRRELRRIAKELALSHRQEQVLALTDQLTNLPNRRAGMDALERVWLGSVRNNSPCALLIFDLDHFKKINDHYGHAVGDQALKVAADVLKTAVRRDETIARIGGEEFLLVSGQMDLREAVVAGERLRRQLEQAEIDVSGERVLITSSIGLALRTDAMKQPDDLMAAADQALYEAKDQGRNQIAINSDGNIRVLRPKDNNT